MIYIECYNDFETLIFLGYHYNSEFKHSLGKGNVLKSLSKTSLSLGIVDEDPQGGEYPQLQDYPIIQSQHGITLRENRDTTSKHVIEIPHNMEKWYENMAHDLGLDQSDYGNLDSFGKFRKRHKGEMKNRFHNFLSDIQIHSGFQLFRNWVDQYS